MRRKRGPPAERRRAGSRGYLELDLEEEPDRDDLLEDVRERLDAEPERAFVERLEDEPERALVDRLDEPERDPPELDLARPDEPDRDPPELDLARPDEPDRDPPELDLARPDEPDRERLDAEPERALLAREPELRDPLDERLDPFDELRDLLDAERLRELDRAVPLRRSAAGISSLATAFASCGICFSRNFAIRSSSRRMPRASLAVSLSFTASASASMPV
jgi:hypothetical protein